MRSISPLPRRAGAATATAAVLLIGGLTACGGSASGGSTAAPPMHGSPSASGSSSGKTVTATETEFKIALSQTSFKPGTYTFVAHNAGAVTHALEITGPGVNDVSTGDIAPGQTQSITVHFTAGSYDVFCPVANHKALGMNVNVTVS